MYKHLVAGLLVLLLVVDEASLQAWLEVPVQTGDPGTGTICSIALNIGPEIKYKVYQCNDSPSPLTIFRFEDKILSKKHHYVQYAFLTFQPFLVNIKH